MSQVRRLDQIPAAQPVSTTDQFPVWQGGRTRIARVQDVVDAAVSGTVPLISKTSIGLGNADNTSDLQKADATNPIGALLTKVPVVAPADGAVSLRNGPRFGQITSAGKWLANDSGRYTNAALTWPVTYLPGFDPIPELVTDYVVSPNGGNTARLSATRNGDQTQPGIQNTIADTALFVANSTDVQKGGWARYTQVNVPAGSAVGLVLGEENSLENLSSFSVYGDPFSDFGIGSRMTATYRMTSGVGRPANNISHYAQCINNGGARAHAGFVFGFDAISIVGGFAPAIQMPPQNGLVWYNSAGNVGWRIFQTGNTGSGSVVFGNNALDIFVGVNNLFSGSPSGLKLGTSGASGVPVLNQGATVDQSVVTDGATGSVTIPNNCSSLIFTPGSTIASETVTFPSAPPNGLRLLISCRGAITALTLTPQAGGTILGSPTSMAANSTIEFMWVQTTGAWYRLR